MVNRPLVENIIADSYSLYKELWVHEHPVDLSDSLNRYNEHIPVWRNMSDDTKRAAIEYVYKNRDTIELNSGCVQSWVQATTYFLLWEFFASKFFEYNNEHIELEMFFDDLDFLMEEDVLEDEDVREMMGISKDFTQKF